MLMAVIISRRSFYCPNFATAPVDRGDEPAINTKIFLQWMNGDGFVSPVYSTTSDVEGKFAFDLSKPIIDEMGVKHEFILAGDSGMQVRTWVENPDPAKYSVTRTGDMSSARFHNRTNRKNESWDFTAGINAIVNSKVVFYERPNHVGWLAKPKDQWKTSGTSDGQFPNNGYYGAVSGGAKVWWENNEAGGTVSDDYLKGADDNFATGVTMVASYVNDEVALQFDAWKQANRGYTPQAFKEAQERMIKEYEAEHGAGSAIAETVAAPVKADGTYHLPFNGIWGTSRTSKGNIITEEEWHTPVPDSEARNDSLSLWNGLSGQRVRHINGDYMYIYPDVGDQFDVWSNHSFKTNMFSRPASGTLNLAGGQHVNDMAFALLTQNPIHNIVEYNNTDKAAAPGDTATTQTAGLSPQTTYIVRWAKNGETIEGSDCTATTDAAGNLPSCDFTVP